MTREKTVAKVDGGEDGKQRRAERHSRSVLLHGYGGAMLRIFGTYQLDGEGVPEKIVVRAYHRTGKTEPWEPSDPSVLSNLDDLEDELRDWEVKGTMAGYRRISKRGKPGSFNKDSIPAPPKQLKPGSFTKHGIPDPLPVKQGGGRGRR